MAASCQSRSRYGRDNGARQCLSHKATTPLQLSAEWTQPPLSMMFTNRLAT